MKRTPIIVAALALAAPVALAACSSGTSMEAVEISFQSQFNDRFVMDMADTGSSLGDYVSGNGDLLDSEGSVIGQFDVNSVTTRAADGNEARFVTAEYAFGDGTDSFLIQGVELFEADGGLPALERPLNYAVVGGTGQYSGASGQCLVVRSEEAFTTECTFVVLGQ